MTTRTFIAIGLLCVVAGGCSSQKKAESKVPLDRRVTDVAPKSGAPSATPASSVPPDPSFVYAPASASQPKFVPVDTPALAPVPTPAPAASPMPASYPMVSATPAPMAPTAPTYASASSAPAPRTPAPYKSPYAGPSVMDPTDLPAGGTSAGPGGALAGGSRQYRVQKGDTLFRIAKSHYGNGNRWQQIAAANPGLSPASLQAGATITVP